MAEQNEFHKNRSIKLTADEEVVKERIEKFESILRRGPCFPYKLLELAKEERFPLSSNPYRDIHGMLTYGSAKRLEDGRLAVRDYSPIGARFFTELELVQKRKTWEDASPDSLHAYGPDPFVFENENPEILRKEISARIGVDPEKDETKEAFYWAFSRMKAMEEEAGKTGHIHWRLIHFASCIMPLLLRKIRSTEKRGHLPRFLANNAKLQFSLVLGSFSLVMWALTLL